jgi:hypothetical protein
LRCRIFHRAFRRLPLARPITVAVAPSLAFTAFVALAAKYVDYLALKGYLDDQAQR